MFFQLKYNGVIKLVTPLGRCSLKSEVPENCANFRVIFNGTLHFIKEDFEFLRNIELKDPFGEIEIYIEDNNIKWTGAFSIAICEVDLCNGIYKVNPYVKDKYTKLLQHWEEEEDIMNGFCENQPFGINELSNFEYKTFSWDLTLRRYFDYEIKDGVRIFANVISDDGKYWNWNKEKPFALKLGAGYNYFLPTLEDYLVAFPESLYSGIQYKDQWLMYKIEYKINKIIRATNNNESRVEVTMTTYFVRYKIFTFNDENGLKIAPDGLLEDAEFSGFESVPGNIATIPKDSISDKWHTYYTCEAVINGKIGNYWYLKANYFMNNYLTKTFFHKGELPVNSVNSIYFNFKITKGFDKNSLKLNSLLENFIKKYDISLELETKGNWCSGDYSDLALINNTELTKETKKVEYYTTFKELLMSLCNHFNLKWDIIGTKFILSNIENFLNYKVTDLVDSTNYKYIKNKKEYKYIGALVPRQEILNCNSNSLNIDFRGVAIMYKSINSSGGNEDNKKTISVGAYSTDISNILLENKNDGLCLVALENVDQGVIVFEEDEEYNIIYKGTYNKKPIIKTSIITGENLLNEPLATSRMMDLFHKTERILKLGNMNFEEIDFENSGWIKEQTDISFKSDLDFNMNDLFKTEIGVGRVTSFEYDFIQKITKINLILQ